MNQQQQFHIASNSHDLSITTQFILIYILIEIVFYLVFIFHLKRKANDLSTKSIKPFRDYGKQRHLLFKRILERMEMKCKLEKKQLEQELNEFLKNWFFPPSTSSHSDGKQNIVMTRDSKAFDQNGSLNTKSIERKYTSISSSESIQTIDKTSYENETTTSTLICKEDLLEFFTWAFFDKHHKDLNSDWEHEELDKMFQLLHFYGIHYTSFKDQDNPIRMTPHCMTLEQCNPLHRPLALYGIFFLLRMIGYMVLYLLGFRRGTVWSEVESGIDNQRKKIALHYWFLDEKNVDNIDNNSAYDGYVNVNVSPVLFFHGIAPAGLTFYLPLIYDVIIQGAKHVFQTTSSSVRHPIFLFENLPITCSLVFDALTEEQTVTLVNQVLSNHGYRSDEKKKQNDLILCGHSFGSFQMTWLIKSPLFQHRLQKIILLDPVSILLSEPDVIMNFVYNRTADAVFEHNGINGNSILEYLHKQKIRILASSELGIEYYLRRHFAWYNSELWLEDISMETEVCVFVSEKDEIIDAAKVMKEIKRFPRVKLTYWKDVGHAALITNPALWGDFSHSLYKHCDVSVEKKFK